MSEFALYPEERHWWSFNDYRAVLDVVRRLQPATVLEFGPGSSTLALIEGGAGRIDACEDDPKWMALHRQRTFGRYRQVRPCLYKLTDPLSIPAIDGNRYDLALIDGPRNTIDRKIVIPYCLERCAKVLLPLECPHGETMLTEFVFGLNPTSIETMETGPLAGVFALITP